jgi:hypothetical protein
MREPAERPPVSRRLCGCADWDFVFDKASHLAYILDWFKILLAQINGTVFFVRLDASRGSIREMKGTR